MIGSPFVNSSHPSLNSSRCCLVAFLSNLISATYSQYGLNGLRTLFMLVVWFSCGLFFSFEIIVICIYLLCWRGTFCPPPSERCIHPEDDLAYCETVSLGPLIAALIIRRRHYFTESQINRAPLTTRSAQEQRRGTAIIMIAATTALPSGRSPCLPNMLGGVRASPHGGELPGTAITMTATRKTLSSSKWCSSLDCDLAVRRFGGFRNANKELGQGQCLLLTLGNMVRPD